MLNKKIILCSTIKNEERNLKKFFSILNDITENFEDYYLIFVLSDCTDNSKKLCQNYLKNKKGFVLTKNFKKQFNRIKRLEICRNEYLNYINNKKKLKNFNYLLVMDADNVNNNINFNIIKNSLKKKEWNALFASQSIFYYDIFALRIKGLIEYNFIDKIKNEFEIYKTQNLIVKKLFKKYLVKFFFLNKIKKNRYIEVISAFGGLAIYRLDKILNFNYDSQNGNVCEHVGLNKRLHKKYGKLYIDKKLINGHGINIHTINGLLCFYFEYFAKRFFKKISK
ncbi:hypothetical protein [Candidatus Pelagibacter sp. HIMB1509]|uniref:hypothetical protein n=1 Tax=Candidatus Pelagibacter sp. HIMB1509 TaxID=3413339 RepID=UPI003F82F8AC